jgi:hypothetical protein
MIDITCILLAILGAIFYLILSYKVIMPFFWRMNNPLTNATKLLVALTFISFAIVSFYFSSSGLVLTRSLLSKHFLYGILLYFILQVIGFVSALVIFRLSSIVCQINLKENEKAELAKDNFQVAGFHGIINIFFSLLLSAPLVNFVLIYLSKL